MTSTRKKSHVKKSIQRILKKYEKRKLKQQVYKVAQFSGDDK